MNKKYIAPELQVIEMEVNSVLCESGNWTGTATGEGYGEGGELDDLF